MKTFDGKFHRSFDKNIAFNSFQLYCLCSQEIFVFGGIWVEKEVILQISWGATLRFDVVASQLDHTEVWSMKEPGARHICWVVLGVIRTSYLTHFPNHQVTVTPSTNPGNPLFEENKPYIGFD